jgi:glycerophosphoryl diester phosphodiesterase
VAAHRGFSGFYPENTLEAYSGALNNGADWVETDFQQTAPDTESEVADPACNTWPAVDGKPEAGKTHWVALHNAGFLATTDVETEFPQATNRDKYTASGIPLVEKFTLCEIKRLDAGSWKTTKWNTDGHVARVPTLEETLDLVRQSRNTTARVMVEPKLGTPQEAVDLYDAIKAYDDAHAADGYWPFVSSGHDDRALFDTFGLEVAKKLASDRPDAEVSFIADEAGEADGSQFAGVSTLLADSLVTQARIDAIHQKGQDVVVWTVNDDDRWLELAARGVDVVITDQSKRARQVLTGTD